MEVRCAGGSGQGGGQGWGDCPGKGAVLVVWEECARESVWLNCGGEVL